MDFISVLLTILVGYIILKEEPKTVADMVSKVSPALVHIMMADRLLNNSTECPESPSGSGFIIDKSGLILTNAHVATANPGSTINVQLPDGQICEGLLQFLDVFLDLALLRINCLPTYLLPIMKLGDSDTLRVGDPVVALGSPLSLSNTVTKGVISNTARSMADLKITSGDEDRKFIQTDAFTTLGNSGGPLVNLEGEVVGINTMVYPGCSISLAIPINVAKKFLSDAAAGVMRDRTKMQSMGMTLHELNSVMIEQMQQYRGLDKSVTHGLMVMDVSLGSPAEVAGMEPGDVIFQMDKKDIFGMLDYSTVFWAGQGSIEMKVKRGNLEVIITV